jgi:hypothetical protein
MTKKKTILEEGTVRRFMRLANLNPLSENYFGEEEIQEEEDEELAVDAVDDAEAEELDAEPEVDVDAEEAPAEEEAVVSAEVATELVSAIAAAVEDVTGVAVEVTGADEAPMEEPEMEEPAMEEPAMEEPEMEEPAEDAEAYRKEEAETPCGEVVAEEEEVVAEDEGPQTITNEELVNYISQRVAKRLEEKKKA